MNVTELARKLKIPTKELREKLPVLGFDIGLRAIKIDDSLVDKIIQAFKAQDAQTLLEKSAEEVKRAPEKTDEETKPKKVIKIPETISVHNFADAIGLTINKVMAELMNNGIMVTINEEIDFETAVIIAEDLGVKVKKSQENAETEQAETSKAKLEKILSKQEKSSLKPRPPVVVIMGHVDHGKTSLLDAIRETNIVASEAGAITQHIGAYQVERKKQVITFIDTPGHEAFKSMRIRGGNIADIAILVIAADDDIQPQTLESIRVIEQAKLPFIVAINKIDKPEADCDKIKTSLAGLNLSPEDWGGKTICVEVSATKKQGLDDLLEMILLVADMEKENLKADYSCPAAGTVIESHKDKNEGPIATVLIQSGACRIGDSVVVGITYGKIRALKNFKNENITIAYPSTPVRLLGLKSAPNVGDIMEVVLNPKELKKKIKSGLVKKTTQFELGRGIVQRIGHKENLEIKNLNIILRADVVGSLEAVVEAIEEVKHEEINLNIVKKGLGSVTESDILQAEASEVGDRSLVIGFNVGLNSGVNALAREKAVGVKIYQVIYELIDDIKKKMEGLLSLERIRHDVGKLEVLKIFRTESGIMVIGGRATQGKITKELQVDILRDGKLIGPGKIAGLQSNKQEVTEIKSGSECGLKISTKAKIEEGDILEFYKIEEKAKKL